MTALVAQSAAFEALVAMAGNTTAWNVPWLDKLRGEALERFKAVGFPTVRDEAWRYTNLAPMLKLAFERAAGGLTKQQLDAMPAAAWMPRRMVFVNGHYASALSSPGDALPIGPAIRDHKVLPFPGTRAADMGAFMALNTVLFEDGAFVYSRGEPLHLLFIHVPGEKPMASHVRNEIVINEGQQTIVETHLTLGEGVYLNNTVTQIAAGPGAHVEHVKLELESAAAFHVGRLQFVGAPDSKLTSTFISHGGRVVRNEIESLMESRGVTTILNGLYLTEGEQHCDNDTLIEHRVPNCSCEEYYKGILRDQSSAVFSGTIKVAKDAQKSDAHQYNRNLLLSEKAVIDTRPQLQILADDVKCAHGVTVGALSDDELFYLRSRGIGEKEARDLLIYAFASEIIDKISVESVRHALQEMLVAGGLS
jgi:Fe-S cluster assembly protein SufD